MNECSDSIFVSILHQVVEEGWLECCGTLLVHINYTGNDSLRTISPTSGLLGAHAFNFVFSGTS